MHLLPVALSIGVASVLGTKLAVRFGTKLVVAAGLLATASFYLWVSTVTVSTGYAMIAAQMVIYGVGMGFTSAPATEAIMGAVPRAKAGMGSAVNDATRLLGGTLGVAVIGSVYASLYASRLAAAVPRHLPAPLADRAGRSAGAAHAIAHQLARGTPRARWRGPRRGGRRVHPRPERGLRRLRRRRGRGCRRRNRPPPRPARRPPLERHGERADAVETGRHHG